MGAIWNAKSEGWDARVAGVSFEACPYTDENRRAAWRKGWLAANSISPKPIKVQTRGRPPRKP